MSIFKDIAKFITSTLPHAIADFFSAAKTDGAKIAMSITEGIQSALKSGWPEDVIAIIHAIFPNVKNIPADLLNQLQTLVPKVLAAELAIQGLPAAASETDIRKFVSDVLTAFNVKSDKSKLYSTLSGEIYTVLRAYTNQGALSWADVIASVEEAFQTYKNALADEETAEVD